MEIEKAIRQSVEKLISEELDKEIEERTKEFHKELTSRKDDYIAEVMKGIRIAQEYNPESMYMDYRIMFINKYEVK
jgi:hypothetical protein